MLAGALRDTMPEDGRPLLGRLLKQSLECERGGTAVEFALVFLPVLLLIFGTLQLAILYTAQSLLENAAQVASRQISTGLAQKSNLTADQFKSTLCAPLTALFHCANIMVDVRVVSSISASDAVYPSLAFGANGQVSNTWSYDPGGPGDMVVLRLMYQWPTVRVPGLDLSNLANGTRFLVATDVVRNESYQ